MIQRFLKPYLEQTALQTCVAETTTLALWLFKLYILACQQSAPFLKSAHMHKEPQSMM